MTDCKMESGTIQAIDKGSVHRICSGQVVLTLATAVKELLENSVDAGATSVEVKLKEYGSECIEVIDNGVGVEEANFEGLTLKHHTSKLKDFDDLTSVSTFGFRGEALSSLCALSNLAILTRHEAASVGTRLELDLNGKIISRKSCPRQVGTTVVVQDIFHSLPVRHKEFNRNLKKEFARLVQVLNAYCIVNTGVRITCSNQVGQRNRTTVVSTNGNKSMKENIADVFGPKQLQCLLEFKQVQPGESICTEYGVKAQENAEASPFRIEGFVSKCEHGQGRSSSDRQFIFINKRPCDTAKILKLINEVYHTYNRHQKPFISLSISLSQEAVDVNVTPDKRQIFLEGEKTLLATLKDSLIQLFEPTTSVYKVNDVFNLQQRTVSQTSPSCSLNTLTRGSSCPSIERSSWKSQNQVNGNDVSYTSSFPSSLEKLKRSFSSAFAKGDSTASATPCSSQKRLAKEFNCSRSFPGNNCSPSDHGSITHYFSKSLLSKNPTNDLAVVSEVVDPSQSPSCDMVDLTSATDSITEEEEEGQVACDSEQNLSSGNRDLPVDVGELHDDGSFEKMIEVEKEDKDTSKPLESEVKEKNDALSYSEKELNIEIAGEVIQQNTESVLQNESLDNLEEAVICLDKLSEDDNISRSRPEPDNGAHAVELDGNCIEVVDEEQQVESGKKTEKVVAFSISRLRERMARKKADSVSTSFSRCFRARICPDDNKSAEDELQKEISKDMFAKMEILGQFNLGFIITKLKGDLFIVDQHATDEKYNFEMLQQHTVLQSQKLIVPRCLELTASNETILADNIHIFKKNGFDFLIHPEAPPTQRVELVSAPASRNWNFGKEDIEELLFMLTDSPAVMCRPSRIRLMFASRACRKSIMIGTALKKSEMRKVVCHMGEIQQPWNCPHGRPTMRHLFSMDMLPS